MNEYSSYETESLSEKEPQALLKSYTLCLNMVEVELKKWGNSVGVIVPVEELRQWGLHEGDKVVIDIVSKKRRNGFGMCKNGKSFREEREGHAEFLK